MKKENKLVTVFTSIADPRSHINKLHLLNDILLIGIVSVICGAEIWKQMVQFAKSKELFFKKFLELPNGIPSEDTINRVFSSIDSEEFESCFKDWVFGLVDGKMGDLISFDGKTIRGAKNKGKRLKAGWNEDYLLLVLGIKV